MRRHEHPDPKTDRNFLTNFLGVMVSPKLFPGILDGRSGEYEGFPLPANWHADVAEWGAALRAVDLSGATFRIVEVGCGWGCWMNNTGAAARRSGKVVHLLGIEGDIEHVALAHEALQNNGFSSTEYSIIHGIAAPSTGVALFPVSENSGGSWGSEPILNATADQVRAAEKDGHFTKLNTYSLADISREARIDLLHIDIQGGEVAFISDNIEDINRLVAYLVIGSHSRTIEGKLIDLLESNGWQLEIERPCIFTLNGGLMSTTVDGVQGWRNPRLIL
jgi:hypothetical protein